MNVCENCSAEHLGTYATGRFCSSKCARGFSTKNNRTDISYKISTALSNRGHSKVNLMCGQCNTSFQVNWNKRHQLYCSRSCATKIKNTTLNLAVKGGLASASKQVKRSKNEISFADLCKTKWPTTITNERIFNGWDADIILPDLKLAILWNGKWHYEKLTKKHSLSQVQVRDKIKIKEIITAGYTPYVICDMGKHNKEFVDAEFVKLLSFIKSTHYSQMV